MAIDGETPTLIKALKTIEVRSSLQERHVTHLRIRHVVVCSIVRRMACNVYSVNFEEEHVTHLPICPMLAHV
jgi:hypothetical protein